MEQGTYNDKWWGKRPQPTEREIQDLIALINADERVTKISVVEPVSVLSIIRTSLGKLMDLPAAILRNKSTT
jgi:hypothetical protein